MRLRLGAALALMLATAARADYPEDYYTPEGTESFNLCRAAVFYHLDPTTRGESRLPIGVVRTLGEQIAFSLQESMASEVPGTLAEGTAKIRFAETWFLSFTRTLQQARDRLVDPVERDRIILDCIPFIWVGMQTDIEQLMLWRDRAIAPPPRPTPEALQALMNARIEALQAAP